VHYYLRYMLWTSLLGVVALAASARQSETVRSENVEVTLLAESSSIQPGVPFDVGLRLVHAPHWHTYWINPADSGLETMLTWTLPEGFSAGPVQWPYPERIVMEPLVTFGYERDVLLIVTLTPPADLEPGTDVVLDLQADWLECKEICLPGSARLLMTLPVATHTPEPLADRAALFAHARLQSPWKESGWSFRAFMDSSTIQVLAFPPEQFSTTVNEAEFFIQDTEIIQYFPSQNWTHHPELGAYHFVLQRDATFTAEPDGLRGVLVGEAGWDDAGERKSLWVDSVIEPVSAMPALGSSSSAYEGMNLPKALFFAFIGGIILNLMPCVFPVISMKIMGFVQQAEKSRAHVFQHGLVFALGVLVSFWLLAGLLLALRAAGDQLGWGFHLQSPVFIGFMASLFFVFGLSLFGVFEVGTSLTGVGQAVTHSNRSSWAGSFFSGALATIIATPCTAPLMGPALGFALTLSVVESLLVFTMLGAGMAFPYVLLSAYPEWLKRIPKPGPWMETLKQTMGWLLVATVVWLTWVLNALAGGDAVMVMIGMLFLFGLGGWILGRWGHIAREFPVRMTAKIVGSVLMLLSLSGGLSALKLLAPMEATADNPATASGFPWEPFSVERFDALRAEGKPVFVNFTAAWCLSCQVNERVAFSSARVQERFAELGIVTMKADWTRRDDVIAGVLARYGRSSVPFYVLYGEGVDREPVTLPEILRPGSVLDALQNL